MLKDTLNEYAYDAEVAGLSYNIENQLEGMLVRVQLFFPCSNSSLLLF